MSAPLTLELDAEEAEAVAAALGAQVAAQTTELRRGHAGALRDEVALVLTRLEELARRLAQARAAAAAPHP